MSRGNRPKDLIRRLEKSVFKTEPSLYSRGDKDNYINDLKMLVRLYKLRGAEGLGNQDVQKMWYAVTKLRDVCQDNYSDRAAQGMGVARRIDASRISADTCWEIREYGKRDTKRATKEAIIVGAFRGRNSEQYYKVKDYLSGRLLEESPSDIPSVLLYGPLGTGKTTYSELLFTAISEPGSKLLKCNAGKLSTVGQVKSLWQKVAMICGESKNHPCFFIVDELDALMAFETADTTLRQVRDEFLYQWQSSDKLGKQLILIATSNDVSTIPKDTLDKFGYSAFMGWAGLIDKADGFYWDAELCKRDISDMLASILLIGDHELPNNFWTSVIGGAPADDSIVPYAADNLHQISIEITQIVLKSNGSILDKITDTLYRIRMDANLSASFYGIDIRSLRDTLVNRIRYTAIARATEMLNSSRTFPIVVIGKSTLVPIDVAAGENGIADGYAESFIFQEFQTRWHSEMLEAADGKADEDLVREYLSADFEHRDDERFGRIRDQNAQIIDDIRRRYKVGTCTVHSSTDIEIAFTDGTELSIKDGGLKKYTVITPINKSALIKMAEDGVIGRRVSIGDLGRHSLYLAH